ncbi:adenosylcobinamide-GDP ribazoletransferase [Nostocoides sp. HKS02]|uniref:adenosylcobinamide-GDP ribazoletransferase n=1 Tax=Nostocoides sp. HKS02 TaxID=1813880 RepID=UPI001E531F77|nr:adenosylcobinamide-GDP ribazoletransferase [Tetrasphaera sp. HKS02]
MRAAFAGLRLAVGTLTMVPVGTIEPPTRRSAAWAMSLAPLAVLPLAAVAGAVGWLGDQARLPGLVVATLVLMSLALGSRAMHLDGLADTVDGIGAGWSRERALEVMKSGDVGPMGVAAVALTLVVQAGGAAAVLGRPWGWLLVAVAVAVSRAACALTCVRSIPAARPDGLGAAVAGTVPVPALAVILVVSAAALGLVSQAAQAGSGLGAVAVLTMTIVVGLLVRIATRVFGG